MRESKRRAMHKYDHSEKGKAAHARYEDSKKGIETRQKYRKTDEYRKKTYAYQKTEEGKAMLRKSRVRCNYGINDSQRTMMLEKQNGVCFLCGKKESEFQNRFGIDHNHITGQIRGLLCLKCNFMIGYANDDINILSKAIEYIKSDGIFPEITTKVISKEY